MAYLFKLKQFIKQCLGLTGESGSRVAHLLLLAVSMMGFSVVALTAASSLFLSRVGASYLPLSYILMGLVSLPAYTWLSQVVDRYNRVRLCQAFLISAALFFLALRGLLVFDATWTYYALHVGCYFQWILVPEVLFASLVSDYFTALDWKRYAPFLKMAMAVGGLLGGGLTVLLAAEFPPENLFLVLPIFYAIAFLQLVYLNARQRPLSAPTAADGEGAINWQTLPALLQDYPIIFFLGSSTFFFILLYSIAEFTYLGIYAEHFSDPRELTSFLGTMRAANNILPFFILYFVTRAAIANWGVSRSNLIYPLTTFLSFIGLATNFNLPAAIFSNVNSDGLDDSLNQPIHNLNYNAVPYAIVGQVRAIANGFVYSFGLAVSGLILWLSKSLLTPLQIAYTGIGLSLLFLVARYWMGQSYVRSLLTLLKSGSANLEQVGEGFTHLPNRYRPQIRLLLTRDDSLSHNLGLELARRIERPSQFLSEVNALLENLDPSVERSLLNFFKTPGDPELSRYLHQCLASPSETVQRLALLAVIASKQVIKRHELHALALSLNPTIQALTYIAVEEAQHDDEEFRALYPPSWLLNLDRAAAGVTIDSLRSTGDRKYIPLLTSLVSHSCPEVKRKALEALAFFARSGDLELALLAATQLSAFDLPLRAAALKLLSVARHPAVLPQLARGLEHSNLAVRLWAAKALAAYGEEGLPLAAKQLRSPRAEVAEAAIAAIGQVRTRAAENLLLEHLKADYSLVLPSLRWQAAIPPNNPDLQPLRIAIEDFRDRLSHRVLYVLSNLDREGTASTIRRILSTSDARLKANALETLAAGSYRRFVVPVLPLFEPQPSGTYNLVATQKSLAEALKASNCWIRLAASFATGGGVPNSWQWPEEFTPEDLPPTPSAEAQFLERTLFLKTVSLLEPLFLDELLRINRALRCEHFAVGEILCAAGTMGRGLHIVWRGKVEIAPTASTEPIGARSQGESALSVLEPTDIEALPYLKPGQFFGEMTLLDDAPLSFSAIARSDCTILTLSKGDFSALVDLYPRLLMGLSNL